MNNFRAFLNEDAEYDRLSEQGQRLEQEHPFDQKDQNIVHHYTNKSTHINSYLWNKHKDLGYKQEFGGSNYTDNDYKQMVSSLDKVTNHKTPEDLKVWSKSIHDPRTLKDKNGIVHHPAYMSTSLSKRVASGLNWNERKDEAGITHHHVYEINIPKGSKGAYLGRRSHAPTQREFLLARGTNLKYNDTKTQEDKNNNYHTHFMDVVNGK